MGYHDYQLSWSCHKASNRVTPSSPIGFKLPISDFATSLMRAYVRMCVSTTLSVLHADSPSQTENIYYYKFFAKLLMGEDVSIQSLPRTHGYLEMLRVSQQKLQSHSANRASASASLSMTIIHDHWAACLTYRSTSTDTVCSSGTR
jgi:hypothetical protein